MNGVNMQDTGYRQISRWACHKLECFADFFEAYKKMVGDNECCYLELYAGCGSCGCKNTDCRTDDASIRALKADGKFTHYIFVVKNEQEADNLRCMAEPRNTDNNATIITGNCIKESIIRQAFNLIPRSSASFAFIDPGGYKGFRWTVIKKLASYGKDLDGRKIDLLIIFPLEMALLRNLTRPECEASISRLYGNRKWLDIKKARLEGEIDSSEIRNHLVQLYIEGLKEAGYRYVDDIEPVQFSNPPVYHVILASDSSKHAKILRHSWGKTRYLPCELLYNRENTTI